MLLMVTSHRSNKGKYSQFGVWLNGGERFAESNRALEAVSSLSLAFRFLVGVL
jgi:hypothetical protein